MDMMDGLKGVEINGGEKDGTKNLQLVNDRKDYKNETTKICI